MTLERKITRLRDFQNGGATRAEALKQGREIAEANGALVRRNAELAQERNLLLDQNRALRAALAILATRAGGSIEIAPEELHNGDAWDTLQIAELSNGGHRIAVTVAPGSVVVAPKAVE